MHLLREFDSSIIITEFSASLSGSSERDAIVDVENTIGSAWRPDGDGGINLVFFGVDIPLQPRGTRNAGAGCGL